MSRDAVAFLLGRWDVVREIVDERRARAGTFRGIADFVPDGAGLRWIETGELEWAGTRRPAGRQLRVEPGRDVGTAEVTFDDGRFFHPLVVAGGASQFVHDCAPDRYSGSLTVTSPERWQLAWDVEGPAKLLRLRATYLRT